MEQDSNIDAPFPHGKIEQISNLGSEFCMTDDQIEEFLMLNFKHIGLKRGANQDEDVALLTWLTRKQFLVAISTFAKFGQAQIDKPSIIPYILNVVNENSPRVALTPTRFKGKLFPPQASIIKRMLEVEASAPAFVMSTGTTKIFGGLLSERLSFGKTYCLPALICEDIIPKIGNDDRTFCDDIVHTNLIVCGTKVAKEWKNNLKNFTSFDFQVIELQKHLDILEKSWTIAKYPEVLVVKDGDITWKGKKAKALEHVVQILDGKCLARVIYDDYDMLKLQPKSEVPNALFTWFVSGTDTKQNAPNITFCWVKDGVPMPAPMANTKIILDATASIQCNREYSSVEYNIPKIDRYYLDLSDKTDTEIDTFSQVDEICSLVQKIHKNEKIENYPSTNDFFDSKAEEAGLITGTKDVPYTGGAVKMLVAIENKQDQTKVINALLGKGIKTVKLTRANVAKFEREDSTVCVAGNLFGVNMGFLTHIVISIADFKANETTQIIGRGQRLSRKQNLQVYFL